MFSDEFFKIIGAIGSITTAGAFIMLFVKDKNKERQIKELIKITFLLENQTHTLNKQNDLLSQQLDIYRQFVVFDKTSIKEKRKLASIDQRKLIIQNRPSLYISKKMSDIFSDKFNIILANKGEEANIIEINFESQNIKLNEFYNKLPFKIPRGKERPIVMEILERTNLKHIEYSLHIKYSDRLGNIYLSKIEGKGMNLEMNDI